MSSAVSAGGPVGERPPPLSRLHTSWLTTLFLCGIFYIAIIPPFKSIDEVAHWDRMWTVATGQVSCRWIPVSASEFVYLVNDLKVTSQVVLNRGQYFVGTDAHLPIATASCQYPPIGYLLPALAARFISLTWDGKPTPGGMFWAFYAARFVNWLLFISVLGFALWRVPWARNLLLVFGSIPEVLQQATALNQDALIFAGTLGILIAWQAHARWRSIAWIIGLSVVMSLMKPIYAGYALVTLLVLPRMEIKKWQRLAVPAAGAVLALGCWWIWSHLLYTEVANGFTTRLPIVGVDPHAQAKYLKSEPWIIFKLMWMQVMQTFNHDPIRGSISSYLGAFGWCQFEVYQWVYHLMLLAIPCALAADVVRGDGPRALPAPRWAWAIVFAAGLAQIPAVIVIMYENFTALRSNDLCGVQGRYFLSLFLLVGAMGFYFVRRRVSWTNERMSEALSLGAACACLVANIGALVWVEFFYWL